MPYTKLVDANPAIRGIDPKVTLAQANEIADWADNIENVDSPWAVAIAQFKKLYAVRDGKWVKKEAEVEETVEYETAMVSGIQINYADGNGSIGSMEFDGAPNGLIPASQVGTVEVWVRDGENVIWTPDFGEAVKVPEEEIEEAGRRLSAAQIKKLQTAMSTIEGILTWANYEDGEPVEEVIELAESAVGHAISLAEGSGNGVVPLHLDIAIIEPGWGNKRDNHYYPKEVLERDAGVFKGVKMYESDHRPNEKSTRTWVSTIQDIVGFTDDGAPIGRVSVHKEDFAKALLALEADGLLDKMECSILADGKAKKGKVNGKKAKIVEAITSAESVDWVTRAGCGGRVLSLTESEEEGAGRRTPTDTEADMSEEEKEELEEVTLEEDQEPEYLSESEVERLLDETNLPELSRVRLTGKGYRDEHQATETIQAEIAYVKELTGSGKPSGLGGSEPAKPLTEEEKLEEFNVIMRSVGAKEI